MGIAFFYEFINIFLDEDQNHYLKKIQKVAAVVMRLMEMMKG